MGLTLFASNSASSSSSSTTRERLGLDASAFLVATTVAGLANVAGVTLLVLTLSPLLTSSLLLDSLLVAAAEMMASLMGFGATGVHAATLGADGAFWKNEVISDTCALAAVGGNFGPISL